MNHNRQLDALLERVRKKARKAATEEDFSAVFSMLRDFQRTVGPLRHDNSAKWYACLAIAIAGGGFASAYFFARAVQQTLGDLGLVIIGAFGIALVAVLIAIGTAGSAIEEISDLIFDKDVLFDNRLRRVNVEDSGSDLYRAFKKEFGDFRSRGDESRYISRLIEGEWTGKERSFPYRYYVFHYVRVYYVTVTKKVGNTTVVTRERRTETLYRYGLILDFPYAKGIAIQGDGGSFDYDDGFEPTSEEFSGNFDVGAVSAMTAAKFLKPAVVLAFLDLAKAFSGLNVEINRQGQMNIAFSDSDVLDLERRSSIADPDAFEAEITSHLGLPRLRKLLEFVETLAKHNDDNFTVTNEERK